jgi:hypothetical protein
LQKPRFFAIFAFLSALYKTSTEIKLPNKNTLK